jgi:DNA-binding MarR family transcriptional regulator
MIFVMPDERQPDPTLKSLWRPLRRLLSAIDADIARIYEEAGLAGVKPSFVMELLRLDAGGPMTITELARSVGRTHSAMSQKMSAMRRAGLVRTGPGPDGRSKTIVLTPKARELAGRLAAEWRATEAALAELEAELPYPVTTVVRDIEAAVQQRSFYDRVKAKLVEDREWQ